MRTGTSVKSREVVAIALIDIESANTSTAEIKSAITSLQIGDTNCTKDFLDPQSSVTTITRNVSNKRRKCCVIYLDQLPAELREELKQGINYVTIFHENQKLCLLACSDTKQYREKG